jgi:hypothetical protein
MLVVEVARPPALGHSEVLAAAVLEAVVWTALRLALVAVHSADEVLEAAVMEAR